MNRLLTLSRYWVLFVAVFVAGALFSACSDDPAGPPAPTGSSKITVMHANPGITSDVVFKKDTATLARLAYGVTGTSTISNGNSTIRVRATDGSELASADVSLDTTTNTMVIFSGTLTQKDAFKVTKKKLTPSAGSAAVRVVNASSTAGDINIRLNSTAGPIFTSGNLSYKSASDYVDLAVSTTVSLVVNKGDNSGMILTIATGAGVFEAGKSYTVVIYGSNDPNADPSVRLTSKIVAD